MIFRSVRFRSIAFYDVVRNLFSGRRFPLTSCLACQLQNCTIRFRCCPGWYVSYISIPIFILGKNLIIFLSFPLFDSIKNFGNILCISAALILSHFLWSFRHYVTHQLPAFLSPYDRYFSSSTLTLTGHNFHKLFISDWVGFILLMMR